ncbi:MAG: DnaA regulatory inactivator Hda [Gammaproteobacteria bacterium]|nr:DnaA regulatory inactivator Hda [Gammaproteobacteria bacterium]NIR84266.1 DnaA regulatory inactivator Hda [Gammaproteobacteria bacterium]NIR89736.1 DnaA regulatory inactivator Hda [Gammaproteobacteria bacterium]NIU05424.1 DnaA regulatory inactivator Hda [Gammaproteobacteria bacterium]NIX86697.1 DnaA regulatory inactivator Hda [Gammaproteobacteria bacterium]
MSPELIQLPLGVGLREGPSLTNFEPGPNREVVAALNAVVTRNDGRCFYLWGPSGCGKTHLLEALCRALASGARRSAYVPLARTCPLEPSVLLGLDAFALVCVDDVDTVAGRPAWEEALFHLYNRLEPASASLVVAARQPPATVPYRLADLQSRFAAGAVYRVRPLDDEGRRAALRRRAHERGFEIPDGVLTYLLRRRARDMHSLFALLERLDRGTLAAKRRVTIPFVRRLLEG